MPELIEQMYCSQQIVIPPKFPYLLKRYCKAAIKTQPYDLLRWSYEYFTALAQHRPPPVKLRLEYPVYSTEGGLTRGCLKVLANQLTGMPSVPLVAVRQAWKGFCLDSHELNKILCLCEVFMRGDTVPFLHFIAVAGGLLTKTLTHTMILLCETLTHEPDGGSAAIPVQDFLVMYRFLAAMDASKDIKYLNGYKEGRFFSNKLRHFDSKMKKLFLGKIPQPDSTVEEEEHQISTTQTDEETNSVAPDEYWVDTRHLQKLTLIDDNVPKKARLSRKMSTPVLGKIKRSPSIERAGQIERETYMRERKSRSTASDEVEEKLREINGSTLQQETKQEASSKPGDDMVEKIEGVKIIVQDEDDNQLPYEIYGEPKKLEDINENGEESKPFFAEDANSVVQTIEEQNRIKEFVNECYENRLNRIDDLDQTFGMIAVIVKKFKSVNYDLGMVAGRQMSTTSGEFIVAQVEKDIMDYVDDQIDILPDPASKKKKAKPEEVAMIREILNEFLDENMEIISAEIAKVGEEDQPLPEVTIVHAVPGIGPIVDEDIIQELEQFLLESSRVQADVIMPRNLRHFMCPPVEKYEEHNYDNLPKKEEVATGGVITD